MSTSDKDSICYKSVRYKKNNFTPETFLGKTTIIPGVSGSGKSFMLNSILKAIAPHVSTLMVFSGTSEVDKKFPMDRYTSPGLIYNTLDIAALSRAIEKSVELTGKYRKYTSLEVLEVTARYLDKRFEKYLSTKMKARKEEIKNLTIEFANLKNPIKTTVDEYKDELVKMYIKYITGYKLIIIKKNIIIQNAAVCEVLRFIDFIPYNAIVLNDLTDEYSSMSNKEKGVFNSILNKGRHVGITLIMLIHTWNGFGTVIRNSAHNIIFTTACLAHNYGSLQKMTGAELRTFNDAIECIISKDRALPEADVKHTCLLYERTYNRYSYIQADPRGKQVYVGIPYLSKRKSRQ